MVFTSAVKQILMPDIVSVLFPEYKYENLSAEGIYAMYQDVVFILAGRFSLQLTSGTTLAPSGDS